MSAHSQGVLGCSSVRWWQYKSGRVIWGIKRPAPATGSPICPPWSTTGRAFHLQTHSHPSLISTLIQHSNVPAREVYRSSVGILIDAWAVKADNKPLGHRSGSLIGPHRQQRVPFSDAGPFNGCGLQKMVSSKSCFGMAAILGASVCSAVAQSDCDPNYENPPCVPIASDVDCAGGKGNGPAYVKGPVRVKVIGIDPYGLDRDKDGIGCERRKRKKRRKKQLHHIEAFSAKISVGLFSNRSHGPLPLCKTNAHLFERISRCFRSRAAREHGRFSGRCCN